MDPLFLGEGTCEHVDLLNTQVPDGSEDLLASRCYRGRIMAIRNRVSFRALFVSAANTSIGTSTTLIAFAVITHIIPCFNASDAFTPPSLLRFAGHQCRPQANGADVVEGKLHASRLFAVFWMFGSVVRESATVSRELFHLIVL